MEFILGALGLIFCVGLVLSGYLVPVLVGGFVGSFFGIAGFGGAVSGMIPGAILGAVIAIAIKQNTTDSQNHVEFELRPDPPVQTGSQNHVEVELRPDPPVEASSRIVKCAYCGQRAKIPAGRRLNVNCPGCEMEYRVDA